MARRDRKLHLSFASVGARVPQSLARVGFSACLGLSLLVSGGCVGTASSGAAAEAAVEHDAHDPITGAEVQAHVDVLASDDYLGREAGSQGEQLASAYLIKALEALPGVQPAGDNGGWLQAFPIPNGVAASPTDDLGDGHNVLAILPGSDPELSQQIVVLGAHYDHVGTGSHGNSLELMDDLGKLSADLSGKGKKLGGGIHNGADDNASGSAVLLELAESLATSSRPLRRTVMFQWYSGEELGLLGSRHYVSAPTRPLEDTVAMLNMDMVGRLRGSTLFVGGVGTTKSFTDQVSRAAAVEDVELVLDRSGIAPSDNSSFYVSDIPVLFFFTGLHEDYHRSTDEAHKLNGDGAARVGRMIEHVLREMDGETAPPEFIASGGEAQVWRPRVWSGMTFEPTVPGELGAARLAVLIPDSPAGRAGFAEGDVIFKLDGVRVLTLKALEEALGTIDPQRTPRVLDIWRPYPGAEPNLDDDWLDVYEPLQLVMHPMVR
ncbi:MAG: hypothetical protein ACI9EF_002883 [Pseudohongiellaceae bacterium]|jgi:hypothetical protein